jgi:predicted AAA+ superfamily ATPase
MLPRTASDTLLRLARGFPILALTGPRQSGKTTLARAIFPNKPYISLENPDEREFADQDPRRFLSRFPDGAVLDEVQRCPALFSWLQGAVDGGVSPNRRKFRHAKSRAQRVPPPTWISGSVLLTKVSRM